MVVLDGEKFSFHNYPFYKQIYDQEYQQLVMKCGRQIAKSTTGNNMILTNSIAKPHFKTLFVSPSQGQTSRFSHSRLSKTIRHSPHIAKNYTSSSMPMNVWMKYFTNGSEVNLTYAQDDPDRARGISADSVIWDEIQDVVYDAVVPVVNECMSESDYQWLWYFGTPKSMENTMEFIWRQSTQDEWVMKCTGCNKWNYVTTVASIGKKGIICVNCGKSLNPRAGQWHSMNPGAYVQGFHIPQLIMPQNNEDEVRWGRILYKLSTYSDSKFKNEVLGMSDAIGTRLVSLEDLTSLCRNYVIQRDPTATLFDDVIDIVAGVDWSGGGSSTYTSRTAIHIWGRLPNGTLKTLYYHVFPTSNPVADVEEIVRICRDYRVDLVAGDAGGGAVANALLVRALGAHKVVQIQYGAVSKMLSWNNKDRYMADRTAAIDSMMMDYKMGKVLFGRKKVMETAFSDILAVYEEVTKHGKGRRIWNSFPSEPDDALHAQVFGRLGMMIRTGAVPFYPIA